jgi:hypothetical protein
VPRALRIALFLGASVAFLCGAAAANGRFPRAERLIEDPKDASHLILGATFGMLLTTDGGGQWRHVCEASFGQADLQTDPVIALAPDGALLAGIYASVTRSEPDACDFKSTLGTNNREAVPDFALSATVPGRVLAVLVKLVAGGASENWLYRSDDNGKSWSVLGQQLPGIATVATVDIAPSNEQRVYVSGLDADGAGILLRSDDAGESFEAFSIPTDPKTQEVPYIAAVDSDDADAIYVRTDDWVFDPVRQAANANDALLFSSDGGAQFSVLMRKSGKLYGFAFSPDNAQLLLGYGDPVEAGGGRLTDPAALGIYRAPKGTSDFEKIYDGSIGCLTFTGAGLYACTLEADTGYTLGLATDTDFSVTALPSFKPLLRLKDVAGPVQCPGCSGSRVCQNYWQSACESWGRNDCESLIPEAPQVCGGAGGSGATSESGGETPTTTGGTPSSDGSAPNDSGCSCRTAPPAQASTSSWLWLAALTIVRARSRDRRAGS